MNRLNPVAIGVSLAITVGLLYVLCALAVAIAPGALAAGLGLVAHGLNIAPLTQHVAPLSGSSVLMGLLALMACSFFAGLLFGLMSNLVSRSRSS